MASRSNPFPMGASDPLPVGYVICSGVSTLSRPATATARTSSRPEPTPTRRHHRPGAGGARADTRGECAWRGVERLALPPPHGSRQAGRSPPPRRRTSSPHHHRLRETARPASPTRVEAGGSQPGAVAEEVTTSPPPTAATVPSEEGATTTSPLPSRTHNPRCDPHFIRQHQRECARGSAGLSPHLDPRPRGTATWQLVPLIRGVEV